MYYYQVYNKEGELVKTLLSAWDLKEYSENPDKYEIKYRKL
jgi:hypothetical protein